MLKAPCFQHDSYDKRCSSCVELNAPREATKAAEPKDKPTFREEAITYVNELEKRRSHRFSALDHAKFVLKIEKLLIEAAGRG